MRLSELKGHAAGDIEESDAPASTIRGGELASHATRSIQKSDMPDELTRDSEPNTVKVNIEQQIETIAHASDTALSWLQGQLQQIREIGVYGRRLAPWDRDGEPARKCPV